jgi:hypothetical protein
MADRLIDLLKADYASRRRSVTCMGIEVWVTPLSMGQQTTIATMHPDDSAARMAESLIRSCHDAEGKPIFAKDDKGALRREVAGDALSPLINAMVGPPVAVQEKNSEAVDQPNS